MSVIPLWLFLSRSAADGLKIFSRVRYHMNKKGKKQGFSFDIRQQTL